MRHFILALLFLIFNSNLVNAQNIVYGLSHDGGSGSSLISIDPINGTTNIIYPNLGALGQEKAAPLTFDSQNGLILVEIFDSTEANTSLWTIDVSTGVVNQLPETESWGFVYDNQNNILCGLSHDGSSGSSLISIDPINGTTNIIYPSLGALGQDKEAPLTFDSQNGLILVETFDSTEANTSLWTIDVSTGVVNQLPKTESWGFVSNIDSNLSTTTIFNSTSSNSIYPNPSSNTINLLNPARVEKLEIIDSNGKIVIDSENQGSAINISHLNTGYYMIRLINKRGTVGIARLIKQ